MPFNGRLILVTGFLVTMLIGFFVWAESTLPPGPSPAILSSEPMMQGQDPMMQQAQKNLFSLHELMHKIDATQDPDKQRELTQEHMRIMQEQMRVMQGLIQGICGMGPVGQDEAELTRKTYFRQMRK